MDIRKDCRMPHDIRQSFSRPHFGFEEDTFPDLSQCRQAAPQMCALGHSAAEPEDFMIAADEPLYTVSNSVEPQAGQGMCFSDFSATEAR